VAPRVWAAVIPLNELVLESDVEVIGESLGIHPTTPQAKTINKTYLSNRV